VTAIEPPGSTQTGQSLAARRPVKINGCGICDFTLKLASDPARNKKNDAG
jgi:hypothetical protein